MIDPDIISAAFGVVLSVVAYLLQQKDAKQGKEIDELRGNVDRQVALLWQKHDQDAKDLSELRLHIASQHYVKTELDARFDKMELAFSAGFHDIGAKLDRLTEALIEKGKPK